MCVCVCSCVFYCFILLFFYLYCWLHKILQRPFYSFYTKTLRFACPVLLSVLVAILRVCVCGCMYVCAHVCVMYVCMYTYSMCVGEWDLSEWAKNMCDGPMILHDVISMGDLKKANYSFPPTFLQFSFLTLLFSFVWYVILLLYCYGYNSYCIIVELILLLLLCFYEQYVIICHFLLSMVWSNSAINMVHSWC